MVDYIIVGAGLAGLAFAEKAHSHNKTFFIYESGEGLSSSVAAGIYNPVILKRLKVVADARFHLDSMNSFYDIVEEKLQQKFRHRLPVLRKFHSIEEQNDWFAASDSDNLAFFLSTEIMSHTFSGIASPFNYGEVLQTGFVDTKLFLKFFREWLRDSGCLKDEVFEYSQIEHQESGLSYKGIPARHIVFAEGFGIRKNPFFNYLPLDGTKGELLTIKCDSLKLNQILNAGLFIVPLGNCLFKVGATYNWTDKSQLPTSIGKSELILRLNEILNADYEILGHEAGIRPTVKDRKPLLGTHHLYKNIHILNGLGTRGVMLAPAMAAQLFEHIEFGKPLQAEVDIKRFSV